MNKKGFVKEYRERLVQNGKVKNFRDAEMDIEIFLKTLKVGLLREGEVKLRSKGKFMVLKKKKRVISNPVTRERMIIFPPKTIKFVISRKIIKRINEVSK